MTKKPFSFFLELLFVLFFFLITSTILIEIYAKMMQVSKEDTYRQEAMIIAQNERAKRSPARWSTPLPNACRWSSSRPAAVPACRRAFSA